MTIHIKDKLLNHILYYVIQVVDMKNNVCYSELKGGLVYCIKHISLGSIQIVAKKF